MPRLKFSHYYKKFPSKLSPTYITAVQKVHYRQLSKEYIEKDTECADGTFYKLPDSDLLIINLATICDGVAKTWQTIRPYNLRKEMYYRSLIGKPVTIVVEERE